MSKKENKVKGNLGEDYACEFLEKLDYKILVRNFNCAFGEIDIIAICKNEIVFIEVKTRCQSSYGNPCEAVDIPKKNHIYNVAKYYLSKTSMLNQAVRFDVIEVYIFGSNNFRINHMKNVILDEPRKIWTK